MRCAGGEMVALRALFTVDAEDETGLVRVLDDLAGCRGCTQVALVVLCRTLAHTLDAAEAAGVDGASWRDVLAARLTLLLDAAAEVAQ